MNILRDTKAYLAGNLENITNGKAVSWRNWFTKQVKPMGIKCISPLEKVFINFRQEDAHFKSMMKDLMRIGRYEQVHEHMKSVIRRDLAIVDKSDFLVVSLEPDIPTFGTLDEIFSGLSHRKPIFMCVRGGIQNTPLWLMGRVPPNFIFNNLEEIIQVLKKIDDGTIPLDEKYWRIFTEEFQ